MNFKKVEKIIKRNGWHLVRINGSHYQYKKVGNPNTVVVPNHNGADLTIGVIKSIEKSTGLSLRK